MSTPLVPGASDATEHAGSERGLADTGRRIKQFGVEETATAKLKDIKFRPGDKPETQKEVLLAMARQIQETHGKAAETATVSVAQQVEAGTESPEAIALVKYEAQYDTLPDEVKSRCTLETLESRLLANDGEYLKFAMGLQNGGDLVHIDPKGNPVLRDGGTEPVMKGMSYLKAFDAIYGEDYKEGVPRHGYEMADDVEEIRAIEAYTGKPFVADEKGEEYRETHLFTGKNPSESSYAGTIPGRQKAAIYSDSSPEAKVEHRGVVRLLRVLER